MESSPRRRERDGLLPTAAAFWDFHEQMFGESFYRNVLALLALRPPQTLVDIGGGTGNFASRLLKALPRTTIALLDQDPTLIHYATARFKRIHRVIPTVHDVFAGPLPPADLTTMLNVSGYFTPKQLPTVFEHVNSPDFLANFVIFEDNDRKPLYHPRWKRLGRRGMTLSWDLGVGDEPFRLHMVRYRDLLTAAKAPGFRVLAEWSYADFKYERLMWFSKGGDW